MEKQLKNIPEIIKQAAKSPLGVVALIIIFISLLAVSLFRNSPDYIKASIFMSVFLGFFIFGLKLLQVLGGYNKKINQDIDGMKGVKTLLNDYQPVKNGKSKLLLKPDITVIHENWKHKVKKMEGIAPRNTVFSDKEIENKVFAIELLEEPLILRKQNKKLTVKINRNNISYALYTNKGKDALCKNCFDKQPHMIKFAKDVDETAHGFF